MSKNRKIGITGARGFIGKNLYSYLLKRGFEVIPIDCDLRNFTEIKNVINKNSTLNCLVHLAGSFSGTQKELIENNLLSTINLLKTINNKTTLQFIYSSSGAVYGNSGNYPISEMTITSPNTENGLIKLLSEQAISYFDRVRKIKSTILRLPSVYGSENLKGVIYNWTRSSREKGEICVYGNGIQHRSFIHVFDVCSAILKIIENDKCGTFNLSSSENYNLLELSEIFVEKFRCKLKFEKQNNNLESMVLDSSKFEKEFGWKAKHTIKSFLDEL